MKEVAQDDENVWPKLAMMFRPQRPLQAAHRFAIYHFAGFGDLGAK
jgi:hypothetical protein